MNSAQFFYTYNWYFLDCCRTSYLSWYLASKKLRTWNRPCLETARTRGLERLQLLSHKYRETPEFWRLWTSPSAPSPTPSKQSCRNSATVPSGGGIDSQFLEVAGLRDKNFFGITCIVIIRIRKPSSAIQSIDCF